MIRAFWIAALIVLLAANFAPRLIAQIMFGPVGSGGGGNTCTLSLNFAQPCNSQYLPGL